jgi:hypothetical protein
MMTRLKRTCCFAAAMYLCLNLAACRSAFVQTAIVNHTGDAVRLIEVDYPSASFGTQQIARNAAYHYRFKIQDSGPVSISFTTGNNKIHTSTGPILKQGQQGDLTVVLGSGGNVTWSAHLSAVK